ncbi:hypothetical protein V9T40_003759 [Parthenolecanium corni]|uniref:ATP-dependent RNA helicase YTHDC2 n=1 Tax=Parthenolecanium corni TaxID=536013 RepID=A0AAN9TVX4_9HEMI
MSFPSSFFANERSYVHNRAKQLGYHSVTTRGFGFSERFVTVYKNKPYHALASKYPIAIIHEVLKKVVCLMDRNPISPLEYRNFVLCKDADDNAFSDCDYPKVKELTELDFNFTQSPGPSLKMGKSNVAINEYRKSLPIYNYKPIILSYLTENKVVIIHGGVASGKSTQVPQFLMEKCLEAKVGYKIFLCEPYRITTVAIAERIAFERREEVGQTVGYQIPLETKKSATSIVICVTPDVLLKMLISKEAAFQGRVIIILDEFDECDYIVEFLLITLKDLFKVNPYLRLILMTNNADVTPLFTYFQYPKTEFDCIIKTACITVNSNLIPIQEFFLEDILMRTDYLNRCSLGRSIRNIERRSSFVENSGNSIVELNTIEVIDSAMDKVWNIGEDDVFIFLINMMKKDVISTNHQLSSNGITLLMAACFHGKMKYVIELVKCGADATIRCQSGFTAIDWASKKDNSTIIEFLQYYLICNNEKVVPDREFIRLTASSNFNEHTNRLITYYDNFYPEHGIDLELLFTVVLHIHAFSKAGAMIVFLPSFFDILAFRDVIFEREAELVSSGGSFILRYLYPNMQTSEQKLIFQVPPVDSRKIILSTNVGAVGITISDLVYVVDTGKIEQKMYVDHTGKISFVTGWISPSHALQRCTKIGRLHPGCCYRLYSQLMKLPAKNPSSNLYTCSPQILCLYTKQIVSSELPVLSYLQRALTVQEESTIKKSIENLKSIDALDICRTYEHLTELGRIMLQLPLEPQYAKMVLFSVALKCLDPILTIAAFSKHKSIFKLEQKYQTKSNLAAKEWKKISSKYFSDHLVLIKMFLGRQESGVDKREKDFCEDYCLSQSTLELVNTTRSNIVGHLRAMGIVKTRGVNDMRDLNTNSKEWVFVKAALVGGLYPNLMFIDRTTNKVFSNKNQSEVLLHPLSVLLDYSVLPSNQTVMLTQNDVVKQFPTDWIICNEINDALTDEIQMASVCTAVTPITLALFGGSYKICTALQNQKTALLIQSTVVDVKESDSENEENAQIIKNFLIDSHLQFTMNEDTAKAVLYLRIKWFSYFFRCLRYPSRATSTEEKQLLEVIGNVLKNEEKYKFPAGDPSFIGNKPATYSIDLFQQPSHSKSVADLSHLVSNPAIFPGLITERMAVLRSDVFCGVDNNFLPIHWLKHGLVPITAIEEYLDFTIINKLKMSVDGTEIDCSLASTLVMMWNTSHMLLRGTTLS